MPQLVYFSIDAGAKAWERPGDSGSLALYMERLLDHWRQFGVLVLPGEKD